jgi:hypothetical protein
VVGEGVSLYKLSLNHVRQRGICLEVIYLSRHELQALYN